VIVDEEMSGHNLPLFESQIKKELESKGRVWSGKMVCVSSAVNLLDDFDNTLTEYLQEPVTTTSLQSIINAEVRSHSKPISNQRLRNTALLVVDDNEFNRDSARQFLEAEGASVHVARNGSEAIKFLRAADSSIDLVLMDVQMPIMDGLEATQRIRAMRRFEYLPIIGLSAGAYAEDIEKALECGMNNYITKPVDIEKTVMAIAELISPESVSEETNLSVTNNRTVDSSESYFNKEMAREYWSSDEKVKKYVAEFIQTYARPLELLFSESEEMNVEFIHKVKGASAILGMPKLTENLTALESFLRNGSGVSEVQVAALVAVWAQTKQEAIKSLELQIENG
jgi:CheY-like chemotaxis protein